MTMRNRHVLRKDPAPASGQRASCAQTEICGGIRSHPILQAQRTLGNRAVSRLMTRAGLQARLTVSQPGDVYEQEADRVADRVMRMPVPAVQRSCAACAAGSAVCPACRQEEGRIGQRKPGARETVQGPANPVGALGTGRPLDPDTLAFFQPRFGYDFHGVRVHDDASADKSARALDAEAYTYAGHIVFRQGAFDPRSTTGRRLLAHELTHVVQQGGGGSVEGVIRRQFVTPLGPGGGYGGVMERDRRAAQGGPTSGGTAAAAAPTSVQVCARDLQGALGYVGNHAYVEAPPFRYAIISPLCPANWYDNPVTGTTAQKWDNSPDPCGKTPSCVPCHPAPGVTNVAACLRAAFSGYSSLSLYRGLGPNSNTFAGTLARACCAGMVPKPAALGNVPGWGDPPAPARAGGTPCPPGPTC